jgi:hypothetical protein
MRAFPINMGLMKVTLSILAVTIFDWLACLLATIPAIKSTCFRIDPPKTFPLGFASDGNIIIVDSAFESLGLFCNFI